MAFQTIQEAGKFDPNNPLHQQSARGLFDNMQTMTAQNGGNQTAAMQLYKDTQSKYGFTDQQFSPYATSNIQTGAAISGQDNYSAKDINAWKNGGTYSPSSSGGSLGLPASAPTPQVQQMPPMPAAAQTPALAAASRAVQPTMATYSRSPYLDPMFEGIRQQATQNLNNNILPNTRYGAQAAGGFGDTRQGIAEGNAIAQTQSSITAQQAQAGQTDYTNFQSNAQQKYAADSNFALGNAQNNNSYSLGQGNLELGNAQNQNNYNLGMGNLALGNRQADNNYSLGQGNLALGNRQADNNYSLGLGNLGLGNRVAENNLGLGIGNLGLGYMQNQNNYNLGLANLGVNAQNSNQNFYTSQRDLDLRSIDLGQRITANGNTGLSGQGQGITSIGNTQQNAPWQVINNANGVMNPYAKDGTGASTNLNGSVFGGATGGAVAGAQLAKLWGSGGDNGGWSTGGGQWNNPSAKGGGSQPYMYDGNTYTPTYK